MSPERAKVFVVEDDSTWQKMIREMLEDAGHQVVATATTKKEALTLVEKLEELGVQVATIDGNLTQWDASGVDGQTVLDAIRTNAPEVKIIGLSGGKVRGADVNLGKANAVNIGETVKNL